MAVDEGNDGEGYVCPESKRFKELIKSGDHQRAWDYLLCWAWLVYGDSPAHHTVRAFELFGGVRDGLKRYDQFPRGSNRVFVGNYLKQLSDRLWDRFYPAWDEPSLWRLVDALGKSGMDCEQTTASKRDAAERRKQRKEMAAATAGIRASQDYADKVSRTSSGAARRSGYRG